MSKSLHWNEIDRLVLAHHREDPTSSIEALERYLKKWWCLTYERPFKDPLLEQYTLDELVYEFLTKYYQKPENDPDRIDQDKKRQQEDDEWASRMLQKEIEKIQQSAESIKKSVSPQKSGGRKKSKKNKADADLPDVISTRFDLPDSGDNKP